MKKVLSSALAFSLIILVTSCASLYSGNYIQRDYPKNLQLLKENSSYSTEGPELVYISELSSQRTEEIRSYFLEQGLDLAAYTTDSRSTWEKSVELARWVAQRIPHTNPKTFPDSWDSISLFEFSKSHKKGINCRMHSLLLGELLNAAGIYNRVITCNPLDNKDPDCHVVNIVWLTEQNKWAMIDSDMTEYIVGDGNVPLSLEEMREYVIEEKSFSILDLQGKAHSETSYLMAYWTKNLFWFDCHSVNGYSLEPKSLGNHPEDCYFVLLPADLPLGNQEGVLFTHNAKSFWAPPAELN